MKLFKKVSNIAISLALLLQLSGLSPFIGSQVANAAQLCSQDIAGANDVPGQKDLTLMCVDYANVPTTLTTKWNWDDTGTSGNNSLDACSLFDTDNDGLANYAVCVTTNGTPATFSTLSTYSCGDTRPDRCTSSINTISNGSTSCSIALANTNPFDAGSDAVATCIISLATIGGASAQLIDVCSYPSQQPNSDPSDCIVRKNNTGKLEVRKVLTTTNTDTFNLLIDGTVKASAVVNGGTTNEVVVTEGNHTVVETAASGSLAGYTKSIVCKNLNGTGSIVAQNATGATLTVPVADLSDIVCVITNTQLTATITLVKQVANSAATTTPAQPNDFNLKLGTTPVSTGVATTVTPGSYTASEVNLPGYTAGTWTGTGCGANGSITVTAGQNITCTITNTAVAPTLTVVKQVTNDNGGIKIASDFTLLVNGTSKPQNQAQSIVAGTSYTVSEQAVTGYTQESIVCKDNTTQAVVVHPVVATLGQNITCTVTNNDQAPSLTLNKIVSNTHGGTAIATNWTLSATGPTPIGGAGTATSGASFKAGVYSLSESTGPTGYQASDWTCTNNVVVTSGQITLLNGQSTTCSITNSDTAPVITVTKVVNNNYGGTATPGSFDLFLGTTQVVSGQAYTSFNAGNYTVSETPMTGYKFVSFSGDCNSIGFMVLAIGSTSSCTITNEDIAPQLTVIKHVVNLYGGNDSADNFTMQVTGTNVSSTTFAGDEAGTTVTLNAGSYSVSEDLAGKGYEQSTAGDCTGTIALGEHKYCTITNTDIAPKVKIVKTVINDNGGTLTASDFGIKVGAATPVFSVDSVSGNTTTYVGIVTVTSNIPMTISEQDVNGYAEGTWSCTNEAPVNGLSTTFTLTEAQNVRCEITNNDLAPSVTITKVVNNNYGGAAVPTSFDLFLGTTQVVSGQAYTSFNAGNYTVSETPKTGYKFVSFSGTCDTKGEPTLLLDTPATCTVTNEDIQPKLNVIKHVVNTYGGTKTAADFTMNVSGTNVGLTGFDGNEAGTDVTLNAGSYSVSEGDHTGYTVSYSTDCTGTITIGEEKTCTVTNTEIQPTITLIKNVINDNGGTAVADDFTLLIGDTQVVSGQTIGVSSNTEYSLGEITQYGYEFNDISGEGCPDYLDGSVTLESGENIVCTLTNDDIAPYVKVFKQVYGDINSTFDFNLGSETATLSGNMYGEPDNVHTFRPNAGESTLSEDVDSSMWVTYHYCYGGDEQFYAEGKGTEVNFNLMPAQRVTCYFINVQKATITVTKYNDLNKNGKQDDGEPTLPDWAIQATISGETEEGSNSSYKSGLTGIDGTVTFDVLDEFDTAPSYTFVVSETQQAGWELTNITCEVTDPVYPNDDEVVLDRQIMEVQPLIVVDQNTDTLHPGSTAECFVGNYKTPVVPPADPPKLSDTGINASIAMYIAGAVVIALAGLEFSRKRN